MEKRRLLLVIMLLATSGAVLAADDDVEFQDGTNSSTTVSRRKRWTLKFEFGLNKASRGRWFKHAAAAYQASKEVVVESVEDGEYGKAMCHAVTVPFWMVWHTTLCDVCPCLERLSLAQTLNVGTGVALGVTVVAAHKAWSKRGDAAEGVKRLFRKMRSFSFRKKAPEKRTDGKAVEAAA